MFGYLSVNTRLRAAQGSAPRPGFCWWVGDIEDHLSVSLSSSGFSEPKEMPPSWASSFVDLCPHSSTRKKYQHLHLANPEMTLAYLRLLEGRPRTPAVEFRKLSDLFSPTDCRLQGTEWLWLLKAFTALILALTKLSRASPPGS